MAKIRVLPEELINKIAAGEVVERPASIVKELIENSLDANTTQVTIDVKNSGKLLIRVADNGYGMDQNDAKASILRHATSKLLQESDLFSIQTLGFRGEALASIAAVSQLSIITKQQQEAEAFNIVLEGGQEISTGILAAETGTTVEVRNLFFNTPARKKFLKSDTVELRHIIDTVIHYALINPNIHFRLNHEGYELLNSPSVDDLRSNIASVYGIKLAKDLLEVSFENGAIKIHGFVAKPHQARNDKSQQAIYVNKRWVRNDDIMQGVYDAYHSTLFVKKHPIVVLNIDLDPTKIDVNVHPNKTKIKIEQKDEVYAAVLESVRASLKENNLVPMTDDELEKQATLADSEVSGTSSPKAKQYPFEPGSQSVFQVKETGMQLQTEMESQEKGEIQGEVQLEPVVQMAPEATSPQLQQNEVFVVPDVEVPETAKFPTMRLLGQVHKTFFVAETLGGLFYIDQHAAHERVLYEKYMHQFMDKTVEKQQLLQGEMMEFSLAEKLLIDEHKTALEELGFTLEHFGENTFIVKTVPMVFGKVQPKEILFEVIALLKQGKNRVQQGKEEIVTRMACRAAVMAGDELTNVEMDKIMQDLSKTDLPYTCPHGRPTVLKVPVQELEKKFKRR